MCILITAHFGMVVIAANKTYKIANFQHGFSCIALMYVLLCMSNLHHVTLGTLRVVALVLQLLKTVCVAAGHGL